MANWCSFILTAWCVDKVQAEVLYDALRLQQSLTADDEGMFIGADSRYLFDSVVDIKNDVVELTGQVKWCVNTEDVEHILCYIVDRVSVQYITIQYEELGCLLYGEYRYDGHQLTHKFVPPELITQDLFDGGCLYQRLEELMNTEAVSVTKTYK